MFNDNGIAKAAKKVQETSVVVLDKASAKLLKQIYGSTKYSKILRLSIVAGQSIKLLFTTSSQFPRTKMLTKSVQVILFDYKTTNEAIKAVPLIAHKALDKQIEWIIMDYHNSGNTELEMFWQDIYHNY